MTESPHWGMADPQNPHPLDASQLELLFDLRNVKVLRTLRAPATAKGVAQTLELPQNIVHYRINKLLEAGLLHVREETTRGRVFETVYEAFVVPQSLVNEIGDALPNMIETLLGRVYRAFFGEFEQFALDLSALDREGDVVSLDLMNHISASSDHEIESGKFTFIPNIAVNTVRLTQERYLALAKRLGEQIHETQDEEGGELCTFAMLSYRGGSLR